MTVLAIKIDVDTERGTRIGVPQLLSLFAKLDIPATFLFSLGPDNTGRAIKRVFRPGFLKKVARTRVVSTYGLATLLNGVLWPGPHIAKRHGHIMRLTADLGHEVGIHCYDHIRWQDGVHSMSATEVQAEFQKAVDEFIKVFKFRPLTAGAAGWQANAHSLAAYDAAQLSYASDSRGLQAFWPKVGDTIFKTLQIPSNLPTLDELLGRPDLPLDCLTAYYLKLLQQQPANIFTIHAELEGMVYLDWFSEFLTQAKQQGVEIVTMATVAERLLQHPEQIPVYELIQGTVPGRSGTLAMSES